MKFKIGFSSEQWDEEPLAASGSAGIRSEKPVKSVVRVYFPARSMTLSYFNDRFDLHRGDIVYVDGKLEGLQGCVVDVIYNFKIKISDYKRVIGVADTCIEGTFYMAGSHFVTFDAGVLPPERARTWFKAPERGDEEYVSGTDGAAFSLDDLSGMKARGEIVERGRDYYRQNKVSYLCIHGERGYAVVEGGRPYEVEFTYRDGEISGLVCSCFCGYTCKHEVAAMLQLRETLEEIKEHYAARYERGGCFAAVSKTTFFSVLIDSRETGSLTLGKT